ncbi:MAG: FAD-dependent oxidoreductase [Oscillospiraceae bacterium]|nr:FAD-dependent oxidoreductase [Oscillospiraceae bacterium]
MSEIKAVFQPIQVGPLRIKNRIEVSPAEPMLCTKEGLVTPEFVDFTAQFARYGAGIVTVGDSPVTQYYADKNHFVVNLADPFVVHGLTRVTEAIHRWGSIASIELNLRDNRMPADFSRDEVKGIIKAFADAAERSRKAGFDMVMLHFGHGHTAATFYSPHLNKRTDEYGCQTFENRCRFALEMIDAVRERIGANMAIEVRMSGDELYPEGVHFEDALRFAKAIEDKIDLIHISAGSMYEPRTIASIIQNTYMPRPTNLYLAKKFKAAGLKIPVVSVGSFDIESAEKAVSEGDCDMVAMIRAFLADPEMLVKAKAGRADEIRPCIRCGACTGEDPHGCPKPLRCSVNATQGMQPRFDTIPPAEAGKKVVIAGGGCAGMEAARRLSERGLKPILFEKEPELGGSLKLAGANPIKGDVRRYAEWSVRTAARDKNIDIRTGVEATRELVLAEKPDALIIAVGSEPIIPKVPGADGQNVCLATTIDDGSVKPGKRVVIVGGGLTGTETAICLARGGHEVTILDMLSLSELRTREKALGTAIKLAEEAGVRFMDRCRLDSISEGAVVALDEGGKSVTLPCDTVALSLGVRPRKKVMEELEGICEETYVIGDCSVRQGNITSAVRTGFNAAMNV